jgi:hypothetical protein
MTRPKNIRPRARPLPTGAHLSSAGVPQPPAAFHSVEVGMLAFPDAPGLILLRLLLDGTPLFIPARLMTNPAGFAAVQLQPQFPYFTTEAMAEAFHQEQAALMRKPTLLTPGHPDFQKPPLLH